MNRLIRICLLLSPALLCATEICAQQKPTQLPGNYPSKPIRVIVGTAPGGGTDIITRPIMSKLSSRWDIPVIVENRTSAAGSIVAMDYARKAPADGYTLLVAAQATFLQALLVNKVIPRDIRETFAPVAQFTINPVVMGVTASLPIQSVKDFIEYAKARPGKLSWGTSGNGSPGHLAGEYLKLAAGIDMTQIPYKGLGPALLDVIGGRVEMLFGSSTALMPHVKTGKLRAIGVTSLKRMSTLPDLPAVAETVPGFEAVIWFGLFSPAGTPQSIVNATNREINAILKLPDIEKFLTDDGAEIAQATPDEFFRFITRVIDSSDRLIKESGIILN